MSVRPYEPDAPDAGYESTGSGLGGKIFVWIAWSLAAAFWAFTLTAGFGILQASSSPALNEGPGRIDAGGLGLLLMEVIGGLVVLGLAIAWGMARWASRNKAIDPITEASTHQIYDMAEAAGGDDDVHRSPEAREPFERDAYRAAGRPVDRPLDRPMN